jgi:hypothetical protein
VLEPRAIDPERRHQHEVLADVDAVSELGGQILD